MHLLIKKKKKKGCLHIVLCDITIRAYIIHLGFFFCFLFVFLLCTKRTQNQHAIYNVWFAITSWYYIGIRIIMTYWNYSLITFSLTPKLPPHYILLSRGFQVFSHLLKPANSLAMHSLYTLDPLLCIQELVMSSLQCKNDFIYQSSLLLKKKKNIIQHPGLCISIAPPSHTLYFMQCSLF